ncbi:MAG: PIN/TRAM domain-containing protein [Phycisphaerales bacterium]|nr:MAG: PIN/TRAM domain-containing protein [Phycisphaerales bacterium]
MNQQQPTLDLHPRENDTRQRMTLVNIMRAAFAALFFSVLLLSIIGPDRSPRPGPAGTVSYTYLASDWHLKLGVGLALGALVVLFDILLPKRKRISTLSALFFGIILAMLATLAIGRVIDLLADLYELHDAFVGTVKVIVGIALAYFGVVTVLMTQDDFRLVIPYVEFAKQIRGPRPMVLDSSALIDARIVDVAATGMVQTPLVIPQFVVGELQRMADSHDKLKRARGRRGLDIIGKLQRSGSLDVTIDETPVPGKAVDQMLVEFTKALPAILVTTDLGLSRVAQIQGVKVLNLNDVANAMKPSVIPGEALTVRLLKPGEQPGQAVGYLDDGTMVVAENGEDAIGEEVQLHVTSTLQTAGGRLLFARIPDGGHATPGEHPALPGPNEDNAENRAESTTGTEAAKDSSAPPDAEAAIETAEPDPEASDTPASAAETPEPHRPAGPRPPVKPKKPLRGRNPRR